MPGPMTDLFGLQMWFISAGLLLGLLSISSFFVPAVMRIEEGPTLTLY
ncbi:MAG: hypothetical protein ACXAEX_13240 [Promethearchaeota archaeon]